MHNLTKRNRLVSKHGRINAYTRLEFVALKYRLCLYSRDDGQQNHRFLKDFFTSTIDLSWSVIFMGFAASFFLSWLVFAVVWYLVAFVHGDLVEDKPKEHVVCVDNIKDFTSCFLFSVETQHTIGWVMPSDRNFANILQYLEKAHLPTKPLIFFGDFCG